MIGDEHWIRAGYLITFVDVANSCENDLVKAVNLTRPADGTSGVLEQTVADSIAAASDLEAAHGDVEVVHLLGGPCQPDKVCCCLVPGATGWSVVEGLSDALKLAAQQAALHTEEGSIAGPIHEGQTVTLHSLKAASVQHLNGQQGIALHFLADKGRWTVRMFDGEGKQVKPTNLAPGDGAGGRVFVFWGFAGWTRGQLLGEIAEGHWGLAKASVADVRMRVPCHGWTHPGVCLVFPPLE